MCHVLYAMTHTVYINLYIYIYIYIHMYLTHVLYSRGWELVEGCSTGPTLVLVRDKGCMLFSPL